MGEKAASGRRPGQNLQFAGTPGSSKQYPVGMAEPTVFPHGPECAVNFTGRRPGALQIPEDPWVSPFFNESMNRCVRVPANLNRVSTHPPNSLPEMVAESRFPRTFHSAGGGPGKIQFPDF